MDPVTLGLIFGAGKGIFDSISQRERQKKQAAQDAVAIRFAPWSKVDTRGLIGKDYSSQGALSGAVSGAATGVQTAGAIQKGLAESDYNQAKADYMKSISNGDEVKSMLKNEPNLQGLAYAKTPYEKLTSQLQSGVDEAPNLLKGQAVRSVPYGYGVGDV